MEKKFSLHSLWFYYTDSWFEPLGAAPSDCYFDTREVAEAERRRIDRIKIMDLDVARDLGSFFLQGYPHTHARLMEYIQQQDWEQYMEVSSYDAARVKSFNIPESATDEQKDAILDITGITFFKVLEHVHVQKYTYVQLNDNFWWDARETLLEQQIVHKHNPTPAYSYFHDSYDDNLYLLATDDNGKPTPQIASGALARKMAVQLFLHSQQAYPKQTFTGNRYILSWSDKPAMLLAYLTNCNFAQLQAIDITDTNSNEYNNRLQQLQAKPILKPGMTFYSVTFLPFEEAFIPEVLGLFELFPQYSQPFMIREQVTSIDGEEIFESMDEGQILVKDNEI